MMNFLLLIFLLTSPLCAATPGFRVMLKSKYDKTWFKVRKDGTKWVCETNHVPYYEAPENPLAKLDWKALEKESRARPKKCAEIVGFENALDGKSKSVVTCLEQKATMELYKRISELCRARI